MLVRIELSVVTILLSAFTLWAFGMFAVAMVRSSAARKRELFSQAIVPKMREALVEYLAGSEQRDRFRDFIKQSRHDMEDAILSFRATVAGGARDRLCELTMEQALLHQWCRETHSRDVMERRAAFEHLAFVCSYEPCRRVGDDILAAGLDDSDSEVRIAAALGLLQTGDRQRVEQVFQLALSHDLLTRALLAEELRRHASALCERAIPDALASADSALAAAALEMLLAWQRALPVDLKGALTSESREVRLRALRLAPMTALTPDAESALLRCLADSDVEIALMALRSAVRLRLESAIPEMARLLREGSGELALAAADALGELPPRGWATLRELSDSPNPETAQAAADALARTVDRGSV